MKRLIICLCLLAYTEVTLQAQEDGSEELSGDAPQPADVPVDGGLSLLLASGAVYGVRRVQEKRRKI